MSYDSDDVETAMERQSWHEVAGMDKGEPFALLLDGEAVLAVKSDNSKLGEGAGSDVWIVIEINGRFFKKSGYHESHYGTDWDGTLDEVKPREATVTVYDNI